MLRLCAVVPNSIEHSKNRDGAYDPEYQRRGIGTALMHRILQQFSHVRQIFLTTDDTPKTKAFYRALGFAPLEQIGCCGFVRLSPIP